VPAIRDDGWLRQHPSPAQEWTFSVPRHRRWCCGVDAKHAAAAVPALSYSSLAPRQQRAPADVAGGARQNCLAVVSAPRNGGPSTGHMPASRAL